MNEINIAQIKERALCANHGPWKVAIKDGDFFVHMENGWPIADCHGLNDASYIAAASPDVVLALIERVERLEEDFEAAARSAAEESVKAVQLEEEAQFLAIRCERLCNAVSCCDDCPYQGEICPEQTIETIDGAGWRKKARRFVEEAHADEE